jgi:hypothetical protein
MEDRLSNQLETRLYGRILLEDGCASLLKDISSALTMAGWGILSLIAIVAPLQVNSRSLIKTIIDRISKLMKALDDRRGQP